MSSSRSRNRSKRSSSYYPTQWSEWEWDVDQRDWKRYRLKSPGEYEFEFESQKLAATANDPAEPRTAPASLNQIQEDSYSASANYALSSDSTAEITRGFAQTTISPGTSSLPPRNQTPGASEKTHITTVDPHTDKEEFDPHYKVHKAFEFKQGRVFKVLWSEPQGSGGGRGDGSSNPETWTERVNKYGEKTFQKVRRFLIIRPLSGHCICLPINTYSRQGVTKNGVHAGDHTIAYTGNKPVYFKGEKAKGLTKTPLKIVTKNPRHKLEETSRLNYAKTYTVEYNVKVWFIGNVDKDHMWHLVTDFNQVHPPLETYGLSEPSAFRERETSYADGGMDDYTPPVPMYGSGISSQSSSYMPDLRERPQQEHYPSSYDPPQASYRVPPNDYSSIPSEPSYNETRPSRLRGKGKEIQRDENPAYDIAEGSEELDHVYDNPSHEYAAEEDYGPEYKSHNQIHHSEGHYAGEDYEPEAEFHAEEHSHDSLHPKPAEYHPHAGYEYPTTTENYTHEHHKEYVEPTVAHEESYYGDEAEHVQE